MGTLVWNTAFPVCFRWDPAWSSHSSRWCSRWWRSPGARSLARLSFWIAPVAQLLTTSLSSLRECKHIDQHCASSVTVITGDPPHRHPHPAAQVCHLSFQRQIRHERSLSWSSELKELWKASDSGVIKCQRLTTQQNLCFLKWKLEDREGARNGAL